MIYNILKDEGEKHMNIDKVLESKNITLYDLQRAISNTTSPNVIKRIFKTNNFENLTYDVVSDIARFLDMEIYELYGLESQKEFDNYRDIKVITNSINTFKKHQNIETENFTRHHTLKPRRNRKVEIEKYRDKKTSAVKNAENLDELNKIFSSLNLDENTARQTLETLKNSDEFFDVLEDQGSISYFLANSENQRPYKPKRGISDEAIVTYNKEGDTEYYRATVCYTSHTGIFMGGLSYIAEFNTETNEVKFFEQYIYSDHLDLLIGNKESEDIESKEISRFDFLIKTKPILEPFA